jgi:deoxyribodipyrimidine photo-lyase
VQVYVGEFDELNTKEELTNIHFKEHPFNKEYKGKEEPRDWMFDVKGYYPSFFAFWKKCKKQFSY